MRENREDPKLTSADVAEAANREESRRTEVQDEPRRRDGDDLSATDDRRPRLAADAEAVPVVLRTAPGDVGTHA